MPVSSNRWWTTSSTSSARQPDSYSLGRRKFAGDNSAPLRRAVTKVALRPRIVYRGTAPDAAALADLHHRSHELCFIANSVTTTVTVEEPTG